MVARCPFRYALMDMHDEHNVTNIGEVRWHLCLCLLLAWILVVIFVSRGIQSTGKASHLHTLSTDASLTTFSWFPTF